MSEMATPRKPSKISACILDKGKELRESIKSARKEITEVEKKLQERFGEDFSYNYSDDGYVDDRYLRFYIQDKKHKMGGQRDIEGAWDSLKDDLKQCLGNPITKLQWEEIEAQLADMVGSLAELDNLKQMLDAVEDLSDDDIPNYESEY